jgi:hypothetical protein
VSGSGLVTAVATGTGTVTATIGGQSASATINVADAAVASVTVTPGTTPLTPGRTVQLTATAKDGSGNTLTGRTVTWSSTPSSVATVSATGFVTAVANGSATITATIGGKSGTATVSVGQPGVASVAVTPTSASVGIGQNTQLNATALSASGTTVTGVTYSWSSASSGTASVSSSGLVTGVAAGSTTITVSAGGKTAQAAISVTGSSGGGTHSGYGNEPSGATTVTERAFNAVVEDGWSAPSFGALNAAITQDGSAPKSPSNVMQVTYPVGLQAGTVPMVQTIMIPNGHTQFYASIWIKYSANFIVDDAGINKIFYVWGSDQTPTLCLCTTSPSPTGNFTPQIGAQDAVNVNYTPNVAGQTGYSFPRNTWVRLEVFLQMNTAGHSDGLIKIWANGVLITNYTNANFVQNGTQATWYQYQLAPYWGGGGGTIATPQFLWVDHMYESVH